MNGYELSRHWFNWCFANPEKIKPIHTALYFFAVEHCNRLGWKSKFGLPTEMAKEAIGVKSWHTFIAAFNDLIEWEFFVLIERSKNQWSSNIIALSNFDEARDEALDKATTKHVSKQLRSTYQSNDSINKLINYITINQEPITKRFDKFEKMVIDFVEGKKDKIEFQFIDPTFYFFYEWLDYKRERKESYKTEKSIKASYEKLVKLSKGDPVIARQILEESYASNYAGFFELKTNNQIKQNNEQGVSNTQQSILRQLEQAERDFHANNG